jgi:hypothetical protein
MSMPSSTLLSTLNSPGAAVIRSGLSEADQARLDAVLQQTPMAERGGA